MEGLQVNPGGTVTYARRTAPIKSAPAGMSLRRRASVRSPEPNCAPQRRDRFLHDPECDERFVGQRAETGPERPHIERAELQVPRFRDAMSTIEIPASTEHGVPKQRAPRFAPRRSVPFSAACMK